MFSASRAALVSALDLRKTLSNLAGDRVDIGWLMDTEFDRSQLLRIVRLKAKRLLSFE